MEKDINKMIEELMASYNRRELSEGELDQVVGGSFHMIGDGHCMVNGQIKTCDEFTSLMLSICQRYGLNVATDMLYNITGYACGETDGETGASDMERMGVIMNGFWANYQ